MIATMSVEEVHLDESITTSRFAQRVAMIRNEANINEALDPQLMIAKLQQQVQVGDRGAGMMFRRESAERERGREREGGSGERQRE